MMGADIFHTAQVSWEEAESDLRAVRETVFIQEQHVPEALEWDGRDTHCAHVLARDKQGRPIGTGRLLPDGHIGRMAVLPAWRHQGVGSALLAALIGIAEEMGLQNVQLDAQTQAMGFYERRGFTAFGEVFMDAGILHRRMRRSLDVTEKGNQDIPDFSRHTLGETRGLVYLHNRADNRAAALRLVEQGSRSLHLHTHNLDPALYNTGPFIEAVKQLALANQRAKVHILLLDPGEAVRHGHRIVELARRISSRIFIHRAAGEDQERSDSFLIVDEVGVLRRPQAKRFEGTVDFNAPGEARILLKDFKEAWERSQPEPELRRLHL